MAPFFTMNKLFPFALPALLALTLAFRPAVAAPQALSAQQVLDAAAQKYAGFSQYQGACSILLEGESAIDGGAPQQIVGSANSIVTFERGESLDVTGSNNFGGTFEAVSTPDLTTISVTGADASPVWKLTKRTVIFQKDKLDKATTDQFLAGLMGVSGGGGATLPALLMGDNSLNPLRAKSEIALQPERNLGTTPCYIVTETDNARKSVTTLWIEKDSFLLRRIQSEIGPTTTPAMTGAQLPPEMLKENPALKDMKVPAMSSSYNNRLLVFTTQVAK